MSGAGRWILGESGYGRLPVVAVDRHGNEWVSWISWNGFGERISTSMRSPGGEWSSPTPVSPLQPLVTDLAMAPWDDGVIVAWIDGTGEREDGLKVVAVNPDGPAESSLISPFFNRP